MTNSRRRRAAWLHIGVAAAAALLSTMMGTLPANASASTSTAVSRTSIDNQSTFAPCANGGAGEVINFSGTISTLFHLTIDDSGGTHLVRQETNLRGQGIGEITGNKYQLIRASTETFEVNSGGFPITNTFQSNFKLISQGSDSDSMANVLIRFTINENGTTTSEIENIRAVCT